MNKVLIKGFRDGLPIGIGYFAVAFSIGIVAANAGLMVWQGFLGSFFTRASAGEYGVYSLIATSAGIAEILLISVIANIRYLLMSTALTQRLSPDMPQWKRIITSCCITDEIFGISIAYPGKYIPMSYPLGATIVAGTMWASGTSIGIIAGNILPDDIVISLSVALYGMFIAIIIPPGRKDRTILKTVLISFILSFICSFLPISSGTRIIILTIIISSVVAYLKPVKDDR